MTILDREPDAIVAPDLDPRSTPDDLSERSGARTGERPERAPFVPSDAARVLLAALSAGAGAIHLAMVPSHAGEWMAEGVAFAVTGWLQILFAVAIVARPSRVLVRLSCLANILFIGAWVVTRVWGPPFGPEAGVAHAASFVDIVCVMLEVVLVVVGYEVLAHPERGSRLSSGALSILSIVPVGILILSTMAIVSPSATSHAASEHSHGEAAAADGHDHGTATPEDDKGLSSIMNGQGDGGGHTHNATVVDLDADTQQQLDAQLANTEALIAKYPTVAAAEADGFYRQGPFSPGLGAHYMSSTTALNFDGSLEGDDFVHPTLIFDGITPDAKLAGFMYMIESFDTVNAPEGFAGPNDHWHYHTNVCLTNRPGGGFDAPLGADTTAPKELCDKYGGFLVANTGYMVHVWTVPGYESSQGTFSNVNPAITCADGTYYVIPLEEIGSSSDVCKDVNT